MSSGQDEPVEFTRGDAERLKAIEVKQDTGHEKLDTLSGKLEYFVSSHQEQHDSIDTRIDKNTRFRTSITRVLIWVLSSGGVLGLLASLAEARGWLN